MKNCDPGTCKWVTDPEICTGREHEEGDPAEPHNAIIPTTMHAMQIAWWEAENVTPATPVVYNMILQEEPVVTRENLLLLPK